MIIDKKLEVIIIGPGRMGSTYATILHQDFRVKILAVCGRSQEKTERLAKQLGCKSFLSRYISNAFKLFTEDAKKVVVIATSEWAHLDPLKISMDHDVSIIIEKPILGSFTDLKHVLSRLRTYENNILPCFTSRFDSRYVEAMNLIEKKNYKPVTIHSRRNTDFKTASRVYKKIDWPYWIIGHDVDLIRWFSSSEVESVNVESRINGKLDLKKDYLMCQIHLKNGSKAFVESSWFNDELMGTNRFSEFRFSGEEINLCISHSPSLTVDSAKSHCDLYTEEQFNINGTLYGNSKNMITHFLDVILNGVQPFVSLNDGIESLRVCEAILRSMQSNKRFYLSDLI